MLQGEELRKLVTALNKKYTGAIKPASGLRQPKRLPTSIFTLDLALCGGIFVQTLNAFHGRESSGKTTAMYKVASQAQILYPEKAVALVDAEKTFDPVWAAKLGVDVDSLIVGQPESGEEAVDMCEAFGDHKDISLVCLDSIGALTPMKEVEGDAENKYVGIHAQLCTRLVRKMNACLARAARAGRESTFLYINQDRSKIGGWSPDGDPIGNPGGKALGHYTSLKVRFKNKETLKKDEYSDELLDMNEHAWQIEKNKFNAGFRRGDFKLLRQSHDYLPLNEGDILNVKDVLNFAKSYGYYHGGGRSWKLEFADYLGSRGSMDEWMAELCENEDLYYALRSELLTRHIARLGLPDYVAENIREQYGV